MDEYNLNIKPENEIEREGNLLAQIGFKSNTALIASVIFGLLLCATMIWGLIIAGVVVLALAVFVQMKVKDYKVMDIYDTNLIIYDLDDNNAFRLELSKVKEWTCKHGGAGADAIMLTLDNGEVIYKDTFLLGKAYRNLNKVMPEKESQALKDEENKKSKLKFDIPFFKKHDKEE